MSRSRIIVATTVLFAVAVSAKLEAAGDPQARPGLLETMSRLAEPGPDVIVSRDCSTPEETREMRVLSVGRETATTVGARSHRIAAACPANRAG